MIAFIPMARPTGRCFGTKSKTSIGLALLSQSSLRVWEIQSRSNLCRTSLPARPELSVSHSPETLPHPTSGLEIRLTRVRPPGSSFSGRLLPLDKLRLRVIVCSVSRGRISARISARRPSMQVASILPALRLPLAKPAASACRCRDARSYPPR